MQIFFLLYCDENANVIGGVWLRFISLITLHRILKLITDVVRWAC